MDVELRGRMVEDCADVVDVHRVENLISEPRVEPVEVRDLAVVLENRGEGRSLRGGFDDRRRSQVQCLTHRLLHRFTTLAALATRYELQSFGARGIPPDLVGELPLPRYVPGQRIGRPPGTPRSLLHVRCRRSSRIAASPYGRL